MNSLIRQQPLRLIIYCFNVYDILLSICHHFDTLDLKYLSVTFVLGTAFIDILTCSTLTVTVTQYSYCYCHSYCHTVLLLLLPLLLSCSTLSVTATCTVMQYSYYYCHSCCHTVLLPVSYTHLTLPTKRIV